MSTSVVLVFGGKRGTSLSGQAVLLTTWLSELVGAVVTKGVSLYRFLQTI